MRLTLINKKEETSNCISFIFNNDEGIEWQAGQFLRYHLDDPQPDERRTERYFTIASAPFEKNIMITTRVVPGDGSTFKRDLQQLTIGDTIDASGPSGSFTIEQPYQEYVFIAGGIGITPFRSILLDLDHRQLPLNITLLYANRDTNIVFRQEIESLQQKYPLFNAYFLIDPQRVDEQTIKQHVPEYDKRTYLVSGPEPMVVGIESMLQSMGIAKEKIKRDYFPGYQGI